MTIATSCCLHFDREDDGLPLERNDGVQQGNSMDDDGTSFDLDSSRSPRHGATVRAGVALLALAVVAASVLASQIVPARPTHAKSGALPSAPAGAGGGRTGPHAPRPATAGATGAGARPGLPGGGAATSSTGGGAATSSTGGGAATSSTGAGATGSAGTTGGGPLRVVEIGDSLGVDLGEAMASTWPPASVQLTVAARGDTGLTNSGYYDWPAQLAGLLSRIHPQVVIVLVGANDLQPMVTGAAVLGDGTPAWNAAYAARVTAIVSESVRAGAHVLWIGEPAMETAFINAGMTRIDEIARSVVARHPGNAAYLDSSSVLAPGGSFSFDVTEPTGQAVQVRTPDGVHLMPAGADLLAAAAARALARTWGMHVTGR